MSEHFYHFTYIPFSIFYREISDFLTVVTSCYVLCCWLTFQNMLYVDCTFKNKVIIAFRTKAQIIFQSVLEEFFWFYDCANYECRWEMTFMGIICSDWRSKVFRTGVRKTYTSFPNSHFENWECISCISIDAVRSNNAYIAE